MLLFAPQRARVRRRARRRTRLARGARRRRRQARCWCARAEQSGALIFSDWASRNTQALPARRGRRRPCPASSTSSASAPTATSSTRQARSRRTPTRSAARSRPMFARARARATLPASSRRRRASLARAALCTPPPCALTCVALAPGRAIELAGGAAHSNPSAGEGETGAACAIAAPRALSRGPGVQAASTCRTHRSAAPRRLSLRRCWRSRRLLQPRRAAQRGLQRACVAAAHARGACVQDTWYPVHRNCSCCKGYVHGACRRAPVGCRCGADTRAQRAPRRCARSWASAAARWRTRISRRDAALLPALCLHVTELRRLLVAFLAGRGRRGGMSCGPHAPCCCMAVALPQRALSVDVSA